MSYSDQNETKLKFMLEHREMIDMLILDSGAWSLNNNKSHPKEMAVPNKLMFYLQDFGHRFDFYFNYDSDFTIGGFENNYLNQLQLEKAGLSPVPVVHDYYGRTEIDHYIKKGYRRVALGSFKNRKIEDILHATKRLKDAGIEVHLFKNASFNHLSRLPVDSADASSWAQNNAHGCIAIWNPNLVSENKTQVFRMQDFQSKNARGVPYLNDHRYKDEILEIIFQSTGITYNNLMGLDSNLYRAVLNCFYYFQIQELITNKQKH